MRHEDEQFAVFLEQLKRDDSSVPADEIDSEAERLIHALYQQHNRHPDDDTRLRMWDRIMAENGGATAANGDTTASLSPPAPDVLDLRAALAAMRRTHMIMAAVNVLVVVLASLLVIYAFSRDNDVPQVVVSAPTGDTANPVSSEAQPVPGDFVMVVMATQPMPPGTHITADMLTVMMWPAGVDLPGPVFSSPDEVVGMFVRGHTSQFEPVFAFNMSADPPPNTMQISDDTRDEI